MNQVTLIGFLGSAPEPFTTTSGTDGARLSLATNETYTRGGERHERTDWHRITAWNGLARSCKHLGKGDQIAIRGKLRTQRWKKDGETRTTVEVEAQEITFLRLQQQPGALSEPTEAEAATAA